MDITLEQVERLREKANISYEEAKAVLEEAGGSLLDALILLEQRGKIHSDAGKSAHYSTRPGSNGGTDAGASEPQAGPEVLALSIAALQLFSLTYITRWLSFATQSYMLAIEKPVPASLISLSTALIFPVIFIVILWPLGLTGIWLNFAATSVLAAVLAFILLKRLSLELKAKENSV